MPLLISGALISPVDQRSYRTLTNALLYVGEDGVIKAIKQIEPAGARVTPGDVNVFLEEVGHSGELERLDLARGEFLIPGFIDTHTVRALHHNICATRLIPRLTPNNYSQNNSMPHNTSTSERVNSTSYWTGSIMSLSRRKQSSRTQTSPGKHIPKS